jgi:hypothetical protein
MLFVLNRNRDKRCRGCEIRCHMVIFFVNEVYGKGVDDEGDLLVDSCGLWCQCFNFYRLYRPWTYLILQ